MAAITAALIKQVREETGAGMMECKAALTEAGFKVKITTANSDTVTKGAVISQSPDKGTGVKGDSITVKESLGPVMVTIPNVRSMGVDAAKKAMTAAGFTDVYHLDGGIGAWADSGRDVVAG